MASRPVPPGLIRIAHVLACPVCSESMDLMERSFRCPARHSFDVARQGYLNLLGRASPANADTSAMVAARVRFLEAGWYAPVTEAVVRSVRDAHTVLEVGAGTGHYVGAYLDSVLDAVGIATDISPAACRIAARRSPRLGAVVADTWAGLPIRSDAVDVVLCVFAPRNPAEFARVLRAGGRLVVVTPAPHHLASLRHQLGLLGLESEKLVRLDQSLKAFTLTERIEMNHDLHLDEQGAADLIQMGPNAFHAHAQPAAASTTAAFTISQYTLPL